MKAANDPARDYRRLVAEGYDACAQAYNDARSREPADVLAPLMERLTPGARVLDLGCGSGVPVARTLATRFAVTGVDISREQVALSRKQVPEAGFLLADMARCEFRPGSFDAVVSLYAIFHLARGEHASLFRRIFDWLTPGGYVLATVGLRDEADYTEDDFFGVEMFWSNFDVDRYREMLAGRGFQLLACDVISHGYDGEDHRAETHPLLFAQRPAP